MIWLVIYLFSVMVALGMGILAGVSDFRGMKIPNSLGLFIVAAFIPAWAAVHFSGHFQTAPVLGAPLRHLAALGAMFVATFLLFSLRIIGGGDAKLLSAYALWTGFSGMPPLLFYMAVLGALLGFVTIYLNKRKPVKEPKEGSWIARAQNGENRVPYGIPIAVGALGAFLIQGYLSPHTLALFLTAN